MGVAVSNCLSHSAFQTTGHIKDCPTVCIGINIGPYEDLLTSVKRRKLVVRARHTIVWTGQDYPTGNSSRRRSGRQRKRWEDNIKVWSGLVWDIIVRKPRTARGGGNWLQNLQWCPNGQPDYGIDEMRDCLNKGQVA